VHRRPRDRLRADVEPPGQKIERSDPFEIERSIDRAPGVHTADRAPLTGPVVDDDHVVDGAPAAVLDREQTEARPSSGSL
jgi:hypothetical protein